MSTPIPIIFSRELPTEPGLYLHRFKKRVRARQITISENGSLYDGYADTFVSGGEWAGPLILSERTKGTGDVAGRVEDGAKEGM